MYKNITIKRQLSIFAVIIVVVPVVIWYMTSYFYLQKQIEKSQQNYLDVAIKVARSEMNNRKAEMLRVANFLSKSGKLSDSISKREMDYIRAMVNNLQTSCDYLDFIMVVDREKNVMVLSNPDIINKLNPKFSMLVDEAMYLKQGISSEEALEISDVYYENTSSYAKFVIRTRSGGQIFTKAGMGAAFAPILNENNEVVGSLVMGDISNNDEYFPNYYTNVLGDSFLAISIDGIRVTSSIKSGVDADFVGTKAPVDPQSWKGEPHFGKVKVGEEVHIYLDEEFKDYFGNTTGIIGVGIPEHVFLNMVTNNYLNLAIFAAISLLIVLFIANILANSITNPILATANLAERIAHGERNIDMEKEYNDNNIIGAENRALVSTFNSLLEQLKKKEADIGNYILQLKDLNNHLEAKVVSRTTALNEAMQELTRADKIKSEFLANMSHELRTPLSVIISSVEALKQQVLGDLNDKQSKYANNILKSATNLLQLINDILDLSKINAGKMNLHCSRFYMLEFTRQMLDEMQSLIRDKNIELELSAQGDDFKITADVSKLRQIFYNVLSNAIKFTDEGRIEVKVYCKGDICEVIVKDSGIGISKENLEKIFVEFVQVDNSYQRKYDGTGLGLALTKKLVEMHGGNIFIKSVLGEGTEVFFTIPIRDLT